MPGYHLLRRDRVSNSHGGLCMYVSGQIQYEHLSDYQSDCEEVLWVKLRPKILPRGVSCIVMGTIYHPPKNRNAPLQEYLFKTLTSFESKFPGCGIILVGDFNHFKSSIIQRQYGLKQIFRFSTRGNKTLDKILTNLSHYYTDITKLSPFGLSDHCTIFAKPGDRPKNEPITRTVRNIKPSNKIKIGGYLSRIDWSILHTVNTIEEKVQLFEDLILTGINIIAPEKIIKIHSNDEPWMTADLKSQIKKRQKAFAQGNRPVFVFYRNLVNCNRKRCRQKYYHSKVKQLKCSAPKRWWNEVKKICGQTLTPLSSIDIFSSLNAVAGMDCLSPNEMATVINDIFLEPQLGYDPLFTSVKIYADHDESPIHVSEYDTFMKLKSLNSNKSSGPDQISPWLLKYFAESFATNSSTM